MSHRRRQFLRLAVSAVALPFLSRAATAQESYPSRPIRLIVGFTPGTAADITARAFGDGYTLFLSSLSIVTSQIINPDPAFDLDKDFAPISLLASGAVVLVVSPQSNLSSVGDLIAMAKSNPGQVLCANAGIGSLPHMRQNCLPNAPELNWSTFPIPVALKR